MLPAPLLRAIVQREEVLPSLGQRGRAKVKECLVAHGVYLLAVLRELGPGRRDREFLNFPGWIHFFFALAVDTIRLENG